MSPDYHQDIVILSVKIQNFVAAVQAVGREEYLQGMNLVSIIWSKLLTVLLAKWSDCIFPLISKDKRSRMEILPEFLEQESVKITTTANTCTTASRIDYQRYKQDSSIPKTQTV